MNKFVCYLCILVMCVSFVTADRLLSESWHLSGDILEIEGEQYELLVSSSGQSVWFKNEDTSKSFIINYLTEQIIGSTKVEFTARDQVTDEISDDVQYYLAQIATYLVEPDLIVNWSVEQSGQVVGNNIYFSLRIENNGSIPAENLEFVHALPETFQITKTLGCSKKDNTLVLQKDLQPDTYETCTYTVKSLDDELDHILRSKITYTDLVKEQELFPPELEIDVYEPFEFNISIEENTLKVTNKTTLNISFANIGEQDLELKDLSVYVPLYFDVNKHSFKKELTSDFADDFSYNQYTKSATLKENSQREEFINLEASVLGYVPIHYSYTYEYDDKEFESPVNTIFVTINSPIQNAILNFSKEVLSFVESFEIFFNTSDSIETLTPEQIDVDYKNRYNYTFEDVRMILTINDSVVYDQIQDEVRPYHRIRIPTITYTPPVVTSSEKILMLLRLLYTINGTTYETNNSKEVTITSPSALVITKSVSASEVEPSDVFTVSVTAKSTRKGRSFPVFFSEGIPDNFLVVGQTKRNVTLLSDNTTTIYIYELIPKDIVNTTTFVLNTTAIINTTDGAIQQITKVAKNIKVRPASKTLEFDVTFDETTVQLGDFVRATVKIKNNGSQEIKNVRVSPKPSEFFDVVPKVETRTLLNPQEQFSTTFVYRSKRRITNEDEHMISALYETKKDITIQQIDKERQFTVQGGYLQGPLVFANRSATFNEQTGVYNVLYQFNNSGDKVASIQVTDKNELERIIQIQPLSIVKFTHQTTNYTQAILEYAHLDQILHAQIVELPLSTINISQNDPLTTETLSEQNVTLVAPTPNRSNANLFIVFGVLFFVLLGGYVEYKKYQSKPPLQMKQPEQQVEQPPQQAEQPAQSQPLHQVTQSEPAQKQTEQMQQPSPDVTQSPAQKPAEPPHPKPTFTTPSEDMSFRLQKTKSNLQKLKETFEK